MDYAIQTRPWTFDWTLEQLERAHDYMAAHTEVLNIIYVLYEDSTDHYIVVAQCTEATAVYINLIV